jgi:hypothetical protein
MNGSTTASKRSPPPVPRDCLIETPASYSRIVWLAESETPVVDRSGVGTVGLGRAQQWTLSVFNDARGKRQQTRGSS